MEKKIRVYIAGPMFAEADVIARKRDRVLLEEALKEEGLLDKVEIYNPIEAPFNDKATLPTAEEIYLGDKRELLSSDYIYAVLDGEDAGVMAEIGMAVGEEIDIVSVLTDIRVGTAGDYDEIRVPFGYNQFIIGLLLYEEHTIHPNTEEAIEMLVSKIKYH